MGNKQENKDHKKEKNEKEGKEEERKASKAEAEKHRDERIESTGQLTLDENESQHNIHLITIIGEIEGHDNLGGSSKTTKYEHILPQLAAIEDSQKTVSYTHLKP